MTVADDDVYRQGHSPDPNRPKRLSQREHRDASEDYLLTAHDIVTGPNISESDWKFSQWCQLQAITHALLGQK